MFFTASKVFWFVAAPANLILLAAGLGTVLLYTRWRGWGRRLCLTAAAMLLIFGFLPFGDLLLRALEDRIPAPAADMPAPDVILVLGGAEEPEITEGRGQVTLNGQAGRLTAAVALARRYPAAQIIFSGGSGELLGAPASEAEVARRFFAQMGVAGERVAAEARSRNTYENAVFTRDQFRPDLGQRWLLVTSAAHMPRALGVFRAAGVAVTPYPVQYRTMPARSQFGDVSRGLSNVDAAAREWLGLVAYRLSGRTHALLPSP